jgi:hypothetical protein
VTDQQTERFVAALGATRVEPRPEFVAELGEQIREEAASSAVSAIVLTDDPREPVGTNLVDYLQQRPDERDTPGAQQGWFGVAVAVAAAILVVVGVVVVADGDSVNVATDPASEPSATDPVATPTVTVSDSGPLPIIVDALGYRWSRVPHDEAIFGADGRQWMNSVTVGGPGLVAVGSVGDDEDADAAVWTSVDGITWSPVAHDEAIFGGWRGLWMSSVTVGGPGLVAVGSAGNDLAAVWTSVDGITWSRVRHDEAVFGGARMNSVIAAGPGLVAVGSVEDDEDAVAAVWTSVDGITWSRVAHDEAVFGGAGRHQGGMNSVTVGGPGLVAVGSVGVDEDADAAVWTSVDGIIWSRVPHDETVFGGAGGQWMSSVTVWGPGLVAVGAVGGWDSPVGSDAAVWTSVDGITWSRVAHDEAVFGGPENQRMNSVTVTGAGLVAVGADGGHLCCYSYEPIDAVVWTSVDGITWSRVAHDEAVFGRGEMYSVTVAGAGLVAVGDEALRSSVPVAEWGESVFVWVAEPED